MIRGNKILIKIFIIILLFLGITLVMGNCNETNAYYDVVTSKWTTSLMEDPLIYCMDHGKDFNHWDVPYKCIERGIIDNTDNEYELYREISYIVENYKSTMYDTTEHEPASNAIWKLRNPYDTVQVKVYEPEFYTNYSPEKTYKKMYIEDILNEASVAARIRDTSGNISAVSPEEVINNNGAYGPFKINYPSNLSNNGVYSSKPIGDIVIKVNGKILDASKMPKSGESFYLRKEDGVIDGDNIIEIEYTGKIYGGDYAIYEPIINPQKYQRVLYINPYCMPFIETASISFKTGITIKGKVWLDGQTGLKPVMEPNGLQDRNEQMLSGIQVIAKRGSDNSIAGTTYTDANGRYELKDIPTDSNGIYVEFIYDGVNYKVTKPNAGIETIDSDVQDVDRTGFNSKFKTIIKNAANGTGGSIPLQYENFTTLKTKNADGTVKPEFAMTARTIEGYKENTEDVDCGLVKKGVDLATVTELLSADVSINGKSQEYLGYGNNNLTIDMDRFNMATKQYTLALYESDYNYRIKDIVLDRIAHANVNGEQSSLVDLRRQDGELEVKLTYKVWLNNQSATRAEINQIAYYYDTNLILNEIKVGDKTITDSMSTLVTIAGKQYKKQIFNLSNCILGNSGQQSFQLVFTVDNNKSYIGEMKNWVEITSYSTDEGCIDKDSAPDNITEHWEEDDSDDANALNIKLKENERKISGYVFEDKKSNKPGTYNVGNGLWTEDENKINGVIVQLIELQEKDGKFLEYIWQETISGSNIVKYVKNDGSGQDVYEVANNKGGYTFKNFIPSTHYIIRFIYGDGTYYDLISDEVVKSDILKYNGQDYKSTIDSGYNIQFYFDETYASNASMARDNEARRLEEIGYAKSLGDNVVGLKIDSKDKLEKTWMCAESSIIEIPLPIRSDATDKLEKTINFGLAKRPQIKLELEKHIIALNVANGKASATANLNDYLVEGSNPTVKLQSQQGEHIFASQSSRRDNQIGSWMVQTAIEDISGQPIRITYGYKVKNIGDEVYIGTLLKTRPYTDLAEEAKQNINKENYIPGQYLGKAYYSGEKGDNDVQITNLIDFQIEDYIDMDMTTESEFTIYKADEDKNIFDSKSNIKSKSFNIIRTDNMNINQLKRLEVNGTIDTTSTAKSLTYRSTVAQIIPVAGNKIAIDGTLISNGFENLEVVRSYANEKEFKDLAPKEHQYVAETVVITMDTGLDKVTPIILILSITGGLAVIAIGIVLIKKFVIK